MNRFVLLLFIVIISDCIYAQSVEKVQHEADSIFNAIQNHADDTIKANAYCLLSAKYRQLDMEKSVAFAQQAIELSYSLNFCSGKKCGYNNLGISAYMLGKYEDAIAAFSKNIEASRLCNDKWSEAWGYNNVGNIYIELGEYDKTLAYYDTSLQIRIKANDSANIPSNLVNIGFVYKDLGQYTQALYYLYNALKTFERYNNENGMAHAYTYLGVVYAKKGEYARAIHFYAKAVSFFEREVDLSNLGSGWLSMAISYKKLNQAEMSYAYLLKALDIYLKLNDTRQLSIVYNFLGEEHLQKKEFKAALTYFQQSLTLKQALSNKRDMATVYNNIATAYHGLKQNQQAINSAQKAEETAKETGSLEQLRKSYEMLALLQAAVGNHTLAYTYQQNYIAIHDSITNIEAQKMAQEIQTKYETEKKDLEISNKTLALDKANLELNKKRTQLILALIAVVIIALLSYLAYSRYKLKQRALHDAELLHQQELRNKAIIEAEEKERIRIARELHDGVGQQLSAVKMNMSVLEGTIKLTNPAQHNQFEALISMVDEAVKEVRSVSHNMMPNALIRSGLVTAVRDFINKIVATGVIKIDLQVLGLNERLEKTTESVLYRVLQETVSNIIKHAQATEVSIQLIRHDEYLNLLIEDNGIGFDTSIINESSGIGLKNIISRISFLNGTVTFDSFLGRGTTVDINIPLQANA